MGLPLAIEPARTPVTIYQLPVTSRAGKQAVTAWLAVSQDMELKGTVGNLAYVEGKPLYAMDNGKPPPNVGYSGT